MKEKCTKYNNSEYDEKEISMQWVTVLKSLFIVYYAPALKLERIFITCCSSVSVNCPSGELEIKET